MAETVKKVQRAESLRKEPRAGSDFVMSPVGDMLQVLAGETVKAGAKESKDEVVGNRTITWVWVEATSGQFVDLRKGFVAAGALVASEEPVQETEVPQPFQDEVERKSFAGACYVQAVQSKTNPAYLYALASALSGAQWSPTLVNTTTPVGALGFGPFRFSTEAWQSLISAPEAEGLQANFIAAPNAQCIVAAIVADKSARLLKEMVTDRSLTALDLFLAHLFADNKSFGSKAAAALLQARRDGKDKSCEAVIAAGIYPDASVRSGFFKRNADLFKEDGSATVEQVFALCADRLKAGFAEAGKVAKELEDCEAEVFESGIPSDVSGSILGDLDRGQETVSIGLGGAVVETQQNATRRLRISQQLRDILEYAGRRTGIDVEVYSGGQPPTGPNRTGSHRHDVGDGRMGAADLLMRDAKSKRILDSDNPADREKIADFITQAASAGAIGIGHAPGYMGSTRTHVGGGQPETVWGTNASRAGAPAWVVKAFEQGRAHALTSSQVADTLSKMRQTSTTPPPGESAKEDVVKEDVVKVEVPPDARNPIGILANEVVRKFAPNAHANYVKAFANGGPLLQENGITTPRRLAHFMAQCLHETGRLTVLIESGAYTGQNLAKMWDSGNWHRYFENRAACLRMADQCRIDRGVKLFSLVYSDRMGNGPLSSGDGWKYRGRGILQTTGREHYQKFGKKCGVDFEGDPDLVFAPEHALKPALAEWREKNCNAAADRDDILAITKAINGGTVGLSERRELFAQVFPFLAAAKPG